MSSLVGSKRGLERAEGRKDPMRLSPLLSVRTVDNCLRYKGVWQHTDRSTDSNLRSQNSSLSVVKGLLVQVLEKSVGDVSLYKLLSDLYGRTERESVTEDLELALWKAFEGALGRKPKKMTVTIVVDGLDQLKGKEAASLGLCERLRKIAVKHNNVKCILISRPLSKSYPSNVRQYVLESTDRSYDIISWTEHSVSSSTEFKNLKEEDKQKIIQGIRKSAGGMFVWADLTLQLLKRENTLAGILQGLEKIPKTLPDLLQKLCSPLDFKQSDTRLIMSWLLAAERPLTLSELKSLIEIDVGTCSHATRFTSIEDDIYKACGSLVNIRDGIVCFSHLSVKQHLLDQAKSGKLSLTLKDAHSELATRSLAYIKVCLKDSHPEPTFGCGWGSQDSAETKSLADLIQKHHLLEYSTRYWIGHFRKSSMYTGGKYTCTSEFKSCFPESSLLALAEGCFWEAQTSSNEALEMHLLALELRKLIHPKSKSVVQCHINLGKTRETLSVHIEASTCYFDAWKISQEILGEKSTVAVACAKAYISCIETQTTTTHTEVTVRTEVTTRTEVTVRTEEIYKYMWTTHKHIHGAADEKTIKCAKALATLYILIKKVEEAATVYREVHKVCVEKYGHVHEITIATSRELVTILQRLSKHEECVQICRTTLEVSEKTLQVWEEKRITATICMVETYESLKQWQKAEELLISIRRSITDVCKSRHEDHLREAMVEITLQYIRFLKRQSRDKEAEKILIELWSELEGCFHGKDHHSEGLLVRIRIIGEEMKKLKIVTVAENVFKTLWGFYKRVDQQRSTEATSIAISLSWIMRSKKETSNEETILKEVFETTTTTTTTETTVIEKTTVTTCVELGSFYEREERWSEAAHVCSKVLISLWSSIEEAGSGRSGVVCYLPSQHRDDAIDIAHRLALCHHKEGRIEKAESIHVHIFRSCRSSLHLHDEKILITAKYLVGFYESVGKIEKAIAVYRELLDEYRVVLGTSHTLSIQIMYHLARICEHHHPKEAEGFYLDIITARGHGSEVCDASSLEAALALCRIYESEKRYKEAQKIYRRLWLTFYHGGHDCGLDTDTLLDIHRNYLVILQKECEFSVVHEFAVQFKETCHRYYGSRHQLTIQVTIELAKILEKEESFHEEAMAIYEELINTTTEVHEHTTIIQTTIIEVKKRLAHLYSVHTTTTSKAEVIYYEDWDRKCKHGHAHEETISALRDLIVYFKDRKTKECTHSATKTLQTTVIEIITKEKDSQRLFYSAEAIANMYIMLGLKDTAFQLINEIRRLIATETKTSEKFKFTLPYTHTVDRRSSVFIIAFEETLKGASRPSLFNEIMSDLMTETTLYESWMRALKYGGRFEVTLSIGARLRLFLKGKDRNDESKKVTDELWEVFLAEVGGPNERSGTVWELFLACIDDMGDEEHNVSIIEAGATAVFFNYSNRNFKGAFELASWVHKYLKAHGGFNNQQNLAIGFKLALCLAGRGSSPAVCKDQELSNKMMELSRTILKEVLAATEHEHGWFLKMGIKEINQIITLLGDHQNFKDLEVSPSTPLSIANQANRSSPLQRLLRDLWEARQTQLQWGSQRIVMIGRRLCEVQFVHGHHEAAMTLCKDIRYNLSRVWGAVSKPAVDCTNLLSSFHSSRHQYPESMALHAEVLQHMQDDDDTSADQLASDGATMVLEQLKLLKRSYQRLGHWDHHGETYYHDLFAYFSNLFHEDKYHFMWKGARAIEPIRKWAPKAKGVADDGMGVWTPPPSWGFPDDKRPEPRRVSSGFHLHRHQHHHELHNRDQEEEEVGLSNGAHWHANGEIGGPRPVWRGELIT